MDVKRYLKRSRLNQYRQCLKRYSQKAVRVSDMTLRETMLKNMFKVRPVTVCPENRGGKVRQTIRILEKAGIDPELKHGFFYSIDEACIPARRNSVIDNMPFDYSHVIDGSLNQYIEKYKKTDNRTAEESVILLKAVEDYIDRICSRLEQNNNIPATEKETAVLRMRAMKDSPARTLEDAL